jgi:hypothetical protein
MIFIPIPLIFIVVAVILFCTPDKHGRYYGLYVLTSFTLSLFLVLVFYFDSLGSFQHAFFQVVFTILAFIPLSLLFLSIKLTQEEKAKQAFLKLLKK